ncbi:phage major tail protein, TP901-1 family [Lactococcus protaetiae]|uniref:Phage major tail protein, TP901-1 family n=1 Tax=Lactococcus protaetiae TaxID=2592653 RepID=A0A514Z7D8_9LACT|nr:phage major tail protein, TP901-1 family [Lactococcus protaetiae]QDK70510.1 phage major tail protein, TP901-1 family [Lactococcus protaetiae]
MADTTTPVQIEGKRVVYLYRLYSDRLTAGASALAFQTENEHTISADSDITATKDGNLVKTKPVSEEITATSLLATHSPLIQKFKDAVRSGEAVEIWEINLDEPTADGEKYEAEYFQAIMTEFTLKTNAEDIAEVDTKFAVNGAGKSGEATLSSENQAIVDYVFQDTTVTNPA